METLGDALPKEMARVRDELIPVFAAIPMGALVTILMRDTLDQAAKAMAAGDVVEMMRAYEDLKSYSL